MGYIFWDYPANIFLLKANKRINKKRWEIYSKRLQHWCFPAICESRNGESGIGMKGMMRMRGMRAIRVGMQGYKNPVVISSDLFFVEIIDLNLTGLTIISLLKKQFIATSDFYFSMFVRSLTVLAKQGKVLSSAKLWTEAFSLS